MPLPRAFGSVMLAMFAGAGGSVPAVTWMAANGWAEFTGSRQFVALAVADGVPVAEAKGVPVAVAEGVAEAVGETVYFAGEATHTEGHFGTVHGALETGERAAEAVLAWWWE